ncbi:GOLPH3/VPS74 family protein [Micromonospora sp. NBC_01813]|uniref:GOLPH3/VPS74 family protein n=1 Tax=Micromonospora sp. NBC_01813 TaxID=2975988 RepID=UPI002DDB63E7|nr:GPP34 family phosphoprotein [Micromonospora sp. NBC_01813]WSA07446.1 GPP34 family phosphoprotein [Micromonospora sp. NBC_01813]
MTSLSLAEELVLLSYDDSGTALIASPDLDYAFAGAVLCDLALAGAVDLDSDGRVVVTGNPTYAGRADRQKTVSGTGSRLLDDALAVIGAGPDRPPEHWVAELSHAIVGRVLDGLADAGLLHREHDRILWIIDRTRYLAPGGVEPTAETDARARLAAARRGGNPVDPRTAALAFLLHALAADHLVMPQLPDPPAAESASDTASESAGPAAAWALAATARTVNDHRAAVANGVFIATNVAAGGS